MPAATMSSMFKSAKETAKILGVSRPTLSRLVKRKAIGAYRVSARRLLFSDQHIRDYLDHVECKPDVANRIDKR